MDKNQEEILNCGECMFYNWRANRCSKTELKVGTASKPDWCPMEDKAKVNFNK